MINTDVVAASQGSSVELKKNMNEVRLFCDLLVQQACQVKEQSLKDRPDADVSLLSFIYVCEQVHFSYLLSVFKSVVFKFKLKFKFLIAVLKNHVP